MPTNVELPEKIAPSVKEFSTTQPFYIDTEGPAVGPLGRKLLIIRRITLAIASAAFFKLSFIELFSPFMTGPPGREIGADSTPSAILDTTSLSGRKWAMFSPL